MSTDFVTAEDAIYKAFYDVWRSSVVNPDILDYIPTVRFGNQESKGKLDLSKHWAWIHMETLNEHQASLRGANQKVRWQSNGVVLVQLFFSKSTLQAGHDGRLADIVKKSFVRSVANDGVWFRRAGKIDLPSEESWHRINVTAEFQYQEIF